MDKGVLKTIADNPAILIALRDVLEEEFSIDGLNTSNANEFLGQIVRARIDGLNALDRAFIKINKYKSIQEKPQIKMRAR